MCHQNLTYNQSEKRVIMNRPYIIKPVFIIEILSFCILLINLIYVATSIMNISGEIPVHFGFDGQIDSYGSPVVLFMLPISMLVTNAIISAMLHLMSPSSWNLPFKVKQGREVIVLTCMAYMIVSMEMEFALYSLIVTIAWIKVVFSVMMIATVAMLFACTASIVVSILVAYKCNKK